MNSCTDSSNWDAVAVVVSLCALLLTVYTAWLSRRHNLISIRPRLASFVQNGLGNEPEGDPYLRIDVGLTNTGLGPALISSYELLVDGVPVPADEPEIMFASIRAVMAEDYIHPLCSFGSLKKGYVMAVGERFPVAVLAIRRPSPGIKAAMKRFHLRVRFLSLYGESFIYDTRTHV